MKKKNWLPKATAILLCALLIVSAALASDVKIKLSVSGASHSGKDYTVTYQSKSDSFKLKWSSSAEDAQFTLSIKNGKDEEIQDMGSKTKISLKAKDYLNGTYTARITDQNGNFAEITFTLVKEEPEPTEKPTPTPEPQETDQPEETEKPEETEVPEKTEEPQETATKEPEKTPAPEETETPEETEVPEKTVEPEETPTKEPKETPSPTDSPSPDDTPVPTDGPSPIPSTMPKRRKGFKKPGMGIEEEQGFHVTAGTALTKTHAKGTRQMRLYGSVLPEAGETEMTVLTLGNEELSVTLDEGIHAFFAKTEGEKLTLLAAAEGERWQIGQDALHTLALTGIKEVDLITASSVQHLNTDWEMTGRVYAGLRAEGLVSADFRINLSSGGMTVTVEENTYDVNDSNELLRK